MAKADLAKGVKVDEAVREVKAVKAVVRDLLKTRSWPTSSITSTSDLAIGDTYRTV